MKSIIYLVFSILILSASVQIATAQQTPKDIKKQRKEQRHKIKEKAVKEARKEAKRLDKQEGWRVFPGELYQ